MYPLDTVKTRMQLQIGKGGADGYNSVFGTLRSIVAKEGFARLYRGILPPIIMEAPKRAIKFSANEQFGQIYRKQFNMPVMTQGLSILTGVSAGVTEAFVVTPFELVKIRLQDKANAALYSGTSDALRKILKNEGPLAFYNGLEATIWRHGLWNGGYFGFIHAVRSKLPKAETKTQEKLYGFIAGALGGTFGTILNTPTDVVKTRVQNQKPSDPVRKYNWTIPAVATIAKEEGVAALYKGFVPKVLRLGPGGGVLLVVFETVSELLRKYAM
ncbi:mitochondrial 2-oxoglutarate/2-oxoadipate transporter-like protein [Ramicandelaber brevisporus]|nr:mitochondrial 2-oxoglutarate/2-oxoadipate transporter-like protein [Ramicandelaber brevisporus]